MVRGRSQRLTALAPAWEGEEGRERLGLSCECPRHPWGQERVEVWFSNPEDGGAVNPMASVVALGHDEEGFERLTLLPAGGYPPDCCVRLGPHWVGWVADGILTESLISGVAW